MSTIGKIRYLLDLVRIGKAVSEFLAGNKHYIYKMYPENDNMTIVRKTLPVKLVFIYSQGATAENSVMEVTYQFRSPQP